MGSLASESYVLNPHGLVWTNDTASLTSINIAPCNYDIGGTRGTYAGNTGQTVTNAATNYIYLDSTGAKQINTTGWPTDAHYRLATVVCAGGIITSITDARATGIGTGSTSTSGVVSDAGGLNVGVSAGRWNISGAEGNYVGTVSYACTDSATNYVYLDSTGALAKSTVAWPTAAHAKLAIVICAGGDITSITDARSQIMGMDASYILSSQKASANGVASLDGASKVVQDPTNATATATAGKLPISDANSTVDLWTSGWNGVRLGRPKFIWSDDFMQSTLDTAHWSAVSGTIALVAGAEGGQVQLGNNGAAAADLELLYPGIFLAAQLPCFELNVKLSATGHQIMLGWWTAAGEAWGVIYDAVDAHWQLYTDVDGSHRVKTPSTTTVVGGTWYRLRVWLTGTPGTYVHHMTINDGDEVTYSAVQPTASATNKFLIYSDFGNGTGITARMDHFGVTAIFSATPA